jgi:hypothetical protein
MTGVWAAEVLYLNYLAYKWSQFFVFPLYFSLRSNSLEIIRTSVARTTDESLTIAQDL